MKKVLLSTSAIALAGAFATSASANEWDMRVGGYFEAWGAYSDVDVSTEAGTFDGADDGYSGIDFKQDAEIHFVPSITLDNGLQFGANVQLEAASTADDQIDEAYVFIKGSFGEINLGSENSAGYKMTYAAPDVSFIGVNSGSLTAVAPISGSISGTVGGTTATAATGSDIFRGTLGTTFLEVGRNNDAQRLTYYTPRFAGFQVGASYARDGQQDSNVQVNTDIPGTLHDIFDIGANYVNSFGDFNVAVSGRYGIGSVEGGDDPTVWAAGLNLGYAGFTLGGSYAESDDSGAQDGEAWDAGISYETGPWAVSATYFSGENVDNENFGGDGGDEELESWVIGMTYTVAKGVQLGAFGGMLDFEEDNGDGGAGTAGDDVESWFIGAGTSLSF